MSQFMSNLFILKFGLQETELTQNSEKFYMTFFLHFHPNSSKYDLQLANMLTLRVVNLQTVSRSGMSRLVPK